MKNIVVVLLVLAAIAAGLYYFRDQIPFLRDMGGTEMGEMMPNVGMGDRGEVEEIEAEGVMEDQAQG